MNPYVAQMLMAERQREQIETARQARLARQARTARVTGRTKRASGKRAPKMA